MSTHGPTLYTDTRIAKILSDLVENDKITGMEAIAITRCLVYSDQIADVSIGSIFRSEVNALLQP